MSIVCKMTAQNIQSYYLCSEQFDVVAMEMEGEELDPEQRERVIELLCDVQTFCDAINLSDYDIHGARFTAAAYFILCDLAFSYDEEITRMVRISRNLHEIRMGIVTGVSERVRNIRWNCLSMQLENCKAKIVDKTNAILKLLEDIVVHLQFEDEGRG